MPPRPTNEQLPFPQAKLGYLNEIFEPDENCSCNVRRNSVISSNDECPCEACGTTKITVTPIDGSSEETDSDTKSRAADEQRTGSRSRHCVKSKTVIDTDFEKNINARTDTSVDCDPDKEETEIPDGGWGYVVLLGAFIVTIITGWVVSCFGILFTDFLLEAKASLTTITAIITMHTCVMNLTWVLAGPFIQWLGWRTVAMAGALLTSSGLAVSAFTPSVDVLFISYSLLIGMGSGMCMMVALGIPSFYFKGKRGKANAIVSSGINVGTVVGPYVISFLHLQYGFRGATLIIAAISLHTCLSAIVFHPVEWHTSGGGNTTARKSTNPSKKQVLINTLTTYWRLLKSARTFVNIVAFASIRGISRTSISLVPLVLVARGHTQGDAAVVTSVLGVCGIIGRIVMPSLTDTAWFNVRFGYIACILVAIVSLIAFSLVNQIVWMTIALGLATIGISGCYSLTNLLMVHYMGLESLMPTLALGGLATAVLQPASSPLYGVFESLTGGYSGPILFMSCQACLAMVLWLLMPIAQAFDKRRLTPLSKKGNIPLEG